MRVSAEPTPRGAREVDALVVGAGLAGLTAARALVAAGAETAVLEARDRVGGRALSRVLGEATFDLGGQYVGPRHARLHGLARELGVETAPTPHPRRRGHELGGRDPRAAAACPAPAPARDRQARSRGPTGAAGDAVDRAAGRGL